MIIRVPKQVTGIDNRRVKGYLALFLLFFIAPCFLANCRSLKTDEERGTANYDQPKYLSNYWIQAENFPVEGLETINWRQPYVFLPPLCLGETGQVSENYVLSTAENEAGEDHSGLTYVYNSDFTLSAKGFSGFIKTLATFFEKRATELYFYKMPENLDQAMMVKYYYKINDANSLKASDTTSDPTYQIVLIILIERMQIEGDGLQLDPVWKGEMVLNVSRSIDWMEAVNLGYHKLSKYALQDGSKKDRANLLNF